MTWPQSKWSEVRMKTRSMLRQERLVRPARDLQQAETKLLHKLWQQQQRTRRVRRRSRLITPRRSIMLESKEVLSSLTPCQRKAVEYVSRRAKQMHNVALPSLQTRVQRLGFSVKDLNQYFARIRDDPPIIIHLTQEVLRHLVQDPWYRSQFETNTSGGVLDRKSRQTWECTLFNSAYYTATAGERPKYGCLNIINSPLGVRSARCYGHLFLSLAPAVRHRTTFAGEDSSSADESTPLGTSPFCAQILATYRDDELSKALGGLHTLGEQSSGYKECQIHGPISIRKDVSALTLPGREEAASRALKTLVASFQKLSGCKVLWAGP